MSRRIAPILILIFLGMVSFYIYSCYQNKKMVSKEGTSKVKVGELWERPIRQMGSTSPIACMVSLDSIRTALELYRMDYEGYPKNLNLSSLDELSMYLDVPQTLRFFKDHKLLSYKSSLNYYEIKVVTNAPNKKVLIATPHGIKEE